MHITEKIARLEQAGLIKVSKESFEINGEQDFPDGFIEGITEQSKINEMFDKNKTLLNNQFNALNSAVLARRSEFVLMVIASLSPQHENLARWVYGAEPKIIVTDEQRSIINAVNDFGFGVSSSLQATPEQFNSIIGVSTLSLLLDFDHSFDDKSEIESWIKQNYSFKLVALDESR